MSTVVVGCKLPQGIHLDHDGKRVTLNGSNSSEIIGGHGLTIVEKAFWDAWKELHKDFEAIKHGLIFAHEKESNTRAEAKEKVDNKSGFEGINPDAPGAGIERVKE